MYATNVTGFIRNGSKRRVELNTTFVERRI